MPRDPSGNYDAPSGTHGTEGTTIESAKYNTYVDDVTADLNLPRPVVAGGTGATNAADAQAALRGEVSFQLVTNYDAQLFVSGSFYSTTATGANAPVDGHAFVGICYTSDPPHAPGVAPASRDLVLEARDQSDTVNPGRKYVRERRAGVWSVWKAAERNIYGDAEGISSEIGDMFFGIKGTAPNSKFIVNDKKDASGNNLLNVQKDGKFFVRPIADQNLVVQNASGTLNLAALKDDMITPIALTISPPTTFSLSPAAPTPTAGDSTTKVATTAFVQAKAGAYLPLAGGALTGAVTSTSSISANGNITAGGSVVSTSSAYAYNGVLYLNAGASRYLQWTSDVYYLAGAHLQTAAGRVWGTGDFSMPVRNGQLAFAGDFSHTSTMQEPYPGACCTGNSVAYAAQSSRYRWMQLYTTGWFTVGTA